MTEENKNEEPKQFLGIVAQYIKDLSFENINPVSQIQDANVQPNIEVQLKVEIDKGTQENVYNVSLIANVQAKLDKPLFILDLHYVGEFLIEGFSEELLTPILYVECPRLIFPFARSIIANAVSEGGFPPLYLAPVNFVELYQQQQEAQGQTIQ